MKINNGDLCLPIYLLFSLWGKPMNLRPDMDVSAQMLYIETQVQAENMRRMVEGGSAVLTSSDHAGTVPPLRFIWPFSPQQARQNPMPVRKSKYFSLLRVTLSTIHPLLQQAPVPILKMLT